MTDDPVGCAHRAKVGRVDPAFDREAASQAQVERRAAGDNHARGDAIAEEGLVDFAGLPGRQPDIVHRHIHRGCRGGSAQELGEHDPEARAERRSPVAEGEPGQLCAGVAEHGGAHPLVRRGREHQAIPRVGLEVERQGIVRLINAAARQQRPAAAVAPSVGRDDVETVGVVRIQNPHFEEAADAEGGPLVEGVEAHLVAEVARLEDRGRTPAFPLQRVQRVGQPHDAVGAQRAKAVAGRAAINLDGGRAAPVPALGTAACHIEFRLPPSKSSKSRLVAPVENATSPSSSPLRPPKISEPSTSSGHQVTMPSSQGK